MVRRLHKGLDPSLAAIVSLKTNGNTLHDFTSQVTAHEAQARNQYQQLQGQFDRQENKIRKLRRTLQGRNQQPEQNQGFTALWQQRMDYAIPAKAMGLVYQQQPAIPVTALQDMESRRNNSTEQRPTIPTARRLEQG
jgi:hypothetical protein